MRSTIMRWISQLVILGVLVPTTAGWAPAPAVAIPLIPPPLALRFYSGMVGIVHGQTARLNTVNTANYEVLTVVLMFVDAEGATLASSTRSLQPGQAAFLDLTPEVGQSGAEGRLQIRAVVLAFVNRNSRRNVDHPALIPMVEVFSNTTGQTLIVLEEMPAREDLEIRMDHD